MFNGNTGVVPQGGVPCKDCERKGCGAYHDQCPEFQAYRAKVDEVRKKVYTDAEKMARPQRKRSMELSPMAITHTHKHRT